MGFIMDRPNDRENPVEPIEKIALDFVRGLLEGKRVYMKFDASKISDDHKTLAYVYLMEDDTFVNETILKAGFAKLSIQPPNTKFSKTLRDAYREAREERRGIHIQ